MINNKAININYYQSTIVCRSPQENPGTAIGWDDNDDGDLRNTIWTDQIRTHAYARFPCHCHNKVLQPNIDLRVPQR